jgi:hypothetical protein
MQKAVLHRRRADFKRMILSMEGFYGEMIEMTNIIFRMVALVPRHTVSLTSAVQNLSSGTAPHGSPARARDGPSSTVRRGSISAQHNAPPPESGKIWSPTVSGVPYCASPWARRRGTSAWKKNRSATIDTGSSWERRICSAGACAWGSEPNCCVFHFAPSPSA